MLFTNLQLYLEDLQVLQIEVAISGTIIDASSHTRYRTSSFTRTDKKLKAFGSSSAISTILSLGFHVMVSNYVIN